MNEPTNPMAVAPSVLTGRSKPEDKPMRRWTEGPCVGDGAGTGSASAGPVRRPPSTAHISDAIQVLRGKRTRYKNAGKMIEARTVQGCIDLLRDVFQLRGANE